ncbi:MAG: hypothetical protein ABEL76_17010, partial [Bradymonadaceae bacterium]
DGGTDAADVAPDTTDAADTRPDTAPPELVVGRQCEDDDDCGMGVCENNYCTKNCKRTSECPDGSECRPFAGRARCVLKCTDAGTCPTVGGRDDLACSISRRRPELGKLPKLDENCLPDGDGDAVHAPADNCPGQTNPTQVDRDSDGSGDACDNKPLCHSDASDGWLKLGPVSYPAGDFSSPTTFAGGYLPVIGGRDGAGDPVDRTAWLSTTDRSFKSGPKLPYPASGHGIAPLPGTRFTVATPGISGANPGQLGRFLRLAPGATPRADRVFRPSLSEPTLATTGAGALVMLGFEQGANEVRRTVRTYNPSDHTFDTLQSAVVQSKGTWSVVRRLDGGLVFYERPGSGASAPFKGTIIRIEPEGDEMSTGTLTYPSLQSGGGGSGGSIFDPILVPGLGGGRYYAFDRATGRAAVLNLDTGDARRQSEIDVDAPFDIRHAAVDVEAPALVLLGRKPNTKSKLRAAVLYPACASNVDWDSDDDSVPDLADNCPTVKNTGQDDADRDLTGNACDDDSDDDGVPDSRDARRAPGGGTIQLGLDSDDDGISNTSDDDIDNDGVPKARDRYPLDTDNDRIPNARDTDDDDDGYSDEAERKNDTDTVDPVDFPGVGRLSFVRRTQGADPQRSASVAPVGSIGEATVVIPPSFEPHRPRLFGSSGVVALQGKPDKTKKLVRVSPARTQPKSTKNLIQVPLRGVTPVSVDPSDDSLTSVGVVRKADGGSNKWILATLSFESRSFTTVVDNFQEIWSPAFQNDAFGFVAQFGSCASCGTLFAKPRGDGSPQSLPSPPGRPEFVRAAKGGYVTASPAPTTNADRLFHFKSQSLEQLPSPPGGDIDSAVPLDFDEHVLVSVEESDGNYDVWLYNGLKQRWDPVTETPDDIIEIDWSGS